MTQTTYIIDFDSTLITAESLDRLAEIALADSPNREETMQALQCITAQGMAGTLAFDESLRQRLMLFRANRGHVATLTSQLHHRISPTALHNKAWFRQNQPHIFVISGGFEDYILPIVTQVGILPTHVFANKFIYDDAGNILGYDPERLLSRPQGKVLQVQTLRLARPIIVIGDGYTDFEIVKYGQADEFWAFTETVVRTPVTEHGDRIVRDFSDVTALATQHNL